MATSDGVGVPAVPDVSVQETWTKLSDGQASVLVDVRTQAEWAFVGVPDLSQINKRVLTVEWQRFPDSQVDPKFAERLVEALNQLGANEDSALFFICRSGARSRAAAEAMTVAGYKHCHNVADGFEGPLNADRHRGTTAGWKAAGLPWAQG